MENITPNTNNFLNWVEIKNFKSVKDLRFDCRRVNVFIGKPNVGKSNILEGLGLLGAGYSTGKFLEGAIHCKELGDLFPNNDWEQRSNEWKLKSSPASRRGKRLASSLSNVS